MNFQPGRGEWGGTWCIVLLCLVSTSCAPLNGQKDEDEMQWGPSWGLPGRQSLKDRSWQDEIIYQIVTDRFANGDSTNDDAEGVDIQPSDLARFQGGDFAGIRQRLDYIQRLGATTIWISPVVDNVDRIEDSDGYHGYWGSNFANVNPRFGTLSDLRGLVSDAHEREMRVVVDVVLNHSGRSWFYDLDEDGALDEGELEPIFSPTAYQAPIEWFDEPVVLWKEGLPWDLGREHFRRQGVIDFSQGIVGDEELVEGDFPSGLRDFDSTNPEVFAALVETSLAWVKATDVDGFRLDVALHMGHEFWREFAREFRGGLQEMGKENFLLLGEAFRWEPEVLGSYTTEAGLDSVFDFSLKASFITEYLVRGEAPVDHVWALSEAREHYRSEPLTHGAGVDAWQGRVTFADNHDTGRLLAFDDDARLLALALVAVFTLDGIPAIYYGTEQSFRGGRGHSCREPLWDSNYDEGAPMFQVVRALSDLRKSSETLRRGSIEVLFASEAGSDSDATDASMVAFRRTFQGESFLVVLNAHPSQESRVILPRAQGDPEIYQVEVDSVGATWQVESDGLTVALPPRGFLVLRGVELGL